MALVMWSGGIDSTLVLCDVAQKAYEEERMPVRVVSVNHDNILNTKPQRAARKKLLDVIRNKLCYYLEAHEAAYKFDGFDPGQGDDGQAAHWIFTASLYAHADDDVYVGFIQTDDVWPTWNKSEAAFQALAAVLNKTLRLHAPLMYEEKHEVLKRLMRISDERKLPKTKRLERLCWWCCKEGPKPCGKCASCNRHRDGLLIMQDRQKRRTK